MKQWSLFEENYSHFFIVWICKYFPRYIISSSPGFKKKIKKYDLTVAFIKPNWALTAGVWRHP